MSYATSSEESYVATSSAATTTQIHIPGYARSYTYDALGNILTSDQGTYAYTDSGYSNPHAVTAIATSTGTTTMAYDNNGNATTFGPLTNIWDYDNRLTLTTVGSTTLTYAYDFSGQRVSYTEGATTTLYANKYYDANATSTERHIYLGDQLLATVSSQNGTTSTHYVLADHLGGTNVVTGPLGYPEEFTDYYPYGSIRIDDHVTSFNERNKYIGQDYDRNHLFVR